MLIQDGDFICYNIDPKKYITQVKEHAVRDSKGSLFEIGEFLNNGEMTLKDIRINYPDIYLKYRDHIHKFYREVVDFKELDETMDYYKKIYDDIKWSAFQEYLINLINPDRIEHRKVNWIFDPKGNSGKSFLARYLKLFKDAYIITGGKSQDIYRHYKNNKIVIYDLPRDYMNENISLYSTMENFKNGFFLDTKYEGCEKIFRPPHIVTGKQIGRAHV